MARRVSKNTQKCVRDWSSYWHRMFEMKHCPKPGGRTVLTLAGLCASVGPPGQKDAQETYYALTALFINPMQRARITKAAEVLASNIDNLGRVVACVTAYNKYIVPNNGREFDKGKYKLDVVIKVMLEIPDGDAYVKSLVQSPLRTPNAIFHARTLENAKKRFKGIFGYDDEGHDDQIKSKVRVIE